MRVAAVRNLLRLLPNLQVTDGKHGVSEGTRTPDTQDHNLVL